jgi:L-ascorbate metabolism protein UlaG (beta-lactamase superfamily)
MRESTFYLKPDVVIEAVVWHWYAHSYLISPTTAPLMIRDKIDVMRSFASAPELHELATRDSSIVGRSFLNLSADKVEVVRQLLEELVPAACRQLEFADAVSTLYSMLLKEARGFSLEGLYGRVPPILRGYVELLYDVNNQPGFRFFESMIYKSELFDRGNQRIFLYRMDRKIRGNIVDTLRLGSPNAYLMPLPFNSETFDDISRLRFEPATKASITSLFDTDLASYFDLFFEAGEPLLPADRKYEGDGIRIRYFGHACVLVQTKDVSVLVDPFINYLTDQTTTNFSFLDLPDRIDYVLITHNHGDHMIPEYLLQLRHRIGNLVVPRNGNGNLEDPSMKLLLENMGFRSVLHLDELDVLKIPGGEIVGMPFLGEHCDLTIRSKILHLVRLCGRSVLLASDSSNLEIEAYRILKKIIGHIDLLFLGMESEGAPLSLNYGAFMPSELNRRMDQSRRVNGSDFESGAAIVDEFGPSGVYVYAMGIEPWTNYILGIKYTEESVQLKEAAKMIGYCRANGIHAEILEGKREVFIPAAENHQPPMTNHHKKSEHAY